VRVGCSGWNYASWRNGVFYPERCPARLWLEMYARSFDTVEVNATFYRLPTTKAVQGWADRTPDDFCFAVKASRYLTHVRRLRELGPGIARFMERLEPLVRLRSWPARETYAYFNNDWEGFAPRNALRLKQLLSA